MVSPPGRGFSWPGFRLGISIRNIGKLKHVLCFVHLGYPFQRQIFLKLFLGNHAADMGTNAVEDAYLAYLFAAGDMVRLPTWHIGIHLDFTSIKGGILWDSIACTV